MMTKICSLGNLHQAFKRVQRNQGSPGIGGETAMEFWFFLTDILADLKSE